MAVNGKRCVFYLRVFSLYLCFTTGNAVFILNPMNVSTCVGSTAVFTCEVNETVTFSWTINEISSERLNFYPMNSPSGYWTQLNVNATSQLHGASVSCLYIDPLPKSSTKAYLAVQGPPTNLTIIQLNATFYKINWGPQYDFQSSFTYKVEIKNDNDAVVYSKTGIANQSVVSSLDPDPCDRYLATVIAKCQNTSEVYNISAWFTGDQPSPLSMKQVTDTFVFEQDNVTMMISQQGVCYFKMEAVSGSDMFLFPHLTPLLSNGDHRIAAVSLPSNKLYVVNITAYNVYGHTSSTFNMSTFDIIDIIVSNGSLMCIFNTGSIARGCLINITDSSSNMTYCRVIERSLNTSLNMSQCSSSCNGPQITGVYIVKAYDIESDGNISKVPSVTLNLTLLGSSCTAAFPARISAGVIAGIVIGILLLCSVISVLIIMFALCWKCRKHQSKNDAGEFTLTPKSVKCPARWGHVAASYNEKLYIWGGCITQMSKRRSDLMKDVWIFDIKLNQWTNKTIEKDSPSTRYSCAYTSVGCQVYVFGGRGLKDVDRYNELFCLNLNDMTWKKCNNSSDERNTPGRKSGAGMVFWNNQLVLFGGYGYCKENYSNENEFTLDHEIKSCDVGWTNGLHVYDLLNDTWRIQSSTATPKPCANFSFMILEDSRVVKIGGNDEVDKANNILNILNLHNMEWSEVKITASGFNGRDYASVNLLKFEQSSKCRILILGGWQSSVFSEMWIGLEGEKPSTSWNLDKMEKFPEHRMKRSGHTSSTFEIGPTHIRVVVLGGYTKYTKTKDQYEHDLPMSDDTFVFDIKTPHNMVNDPSLWEWSQEEGRQEESIETYHATKA